MMMDTSHALRMGLLRVMKGTKMRHLIAWRVNQLKDVVSLISVLSIYVLSLVRCGYVVNTYACTASVCAHPPGYAALVQ